MSTSYAAPPNRAYHKPPSSVGIQDGFDLYANPDPDSETTIALIKAPIVFSANSYSTPLTQPIGLAYLAAVLEKAQYRVQVVDCPGADPDHIQYTPSRQFKVQGLDLGEALSRIDPQSDIIGVTIMFSQEWPFIRDFIHGIRERFPHAKIVAGGEHITALPEFSLRDCPAIDYAILGEGELAFLELVHKLRSAQPANEVQGVACLDNGGFRTAQLSPRLAQVEGFPWPAWHLIDAHSYFKPNFTMGISHGRNMAMVATRGCPYQCTFCSSPTMWTTRYVMRPAVDVVNEIEHNIQEYGCNSIEFYDLTAIVKKEWVLEFTAELERRNLGITWQLPSGTRSESIDEQVIESMAKTGCEFVVYAPESGSQRSLDMIKKRVNLKNLQNSIRIAKRYGLVVKVNFIVAFPFETRQDILQTVLFVWKLALLNVDDCNISTFAAYPGSEIYEELIEGNELQKPDDEYFHSLITQFDFTVQKTVCRHVGAVEVLVYRILGMSVFYVLSYLRSPVRILRLLRLTRLLVGAKTWSPRSLFEQRVYDAIARFKTSV